MVDGASNATHVLKDARLVEVATTIESVIVHRLRVLVTDEQIKDVIASRVMIRFASSAPMGTTYTRVNVLLNALPTLQSQLGLGDSIGTADQSLVKRRYSQASV